MKRRLMLLIGMLVLVASALFTVAYLLIIDSINEEACASIQNGMTQAEVAGMLGRLFDRADCHLDWGKSQNPDGTRGSTLLAN